MRDGGGTIAPARQRPTDASGSRRIDVLIVDDQPTFRKTLRDLVDATPELTLAGEADTGEAALDAVESLAPHMVIMDKRMPGIGGLEATRRIVARHPHVIVVLVSIEAPEPGLLEECGAAAFLRKQQLSPPTLSEVWRKHGG